ncbi:uncharacterized protein BO88DRAFT_47164 [Aspergillus vadensis CBS 113365]|uniref:Uncharacterized protein n=1 Tax=Aspergillus vadensis (strain CBS 113365 / IMI 142717 / IBT 24658) TaxID=1448311 RepID=A0A319BBH1_ASPVC|nr:hypothetical protein BO88DRAFT_47164 [Aspergillus vadensis CBS 113365]PYH69331.1 hypothetical protein BO88DRAFT_47164 [Aspergillus vadensis CBS 113365]
MLVGDPCTTACLVGHEMSGFFRIISSESGLAGQMRPAHSLFIHGLLLIIIYLLFIHCALLPLQGSCVVGLNFIIAQVSYMFLHLPLILLIGGFPILNRFPAILSDSALDFPAGAQPRLASCLFARPTNFFRAHRSRTAIIIAQPSPVNNYFFLFPPPHVRVPFSQILFISLLLSLVW